MGTFTYTKALVSLLVFWYFIIPSCTLVLLIQIFQAPHVFNYYVQFHIYCNCYITQHYSLYILFLGFKMRSSPIGISLNIKNVFWCTFFSLVVGRRRKPDRILMGYFSRKCRKIARYFTMSIVPVLYRLSSFLIAILIINGAKVCSGWYYIKTVLLKIKHMGSSIYIFRTSTSSYYFISVEIWYLFFGMQAEFGSKIFLVFDVS